MTSPRKRPPLLIRILLGAVFFVAAILALLVAFILVDNIRSRAAWRAYEAEAKQKGVALHYTAFVPPPLPDEQNFAAIPLFQDTFKEKAANGTVPDPCKLPQKAGLQPPAPADPAKLQPVDLAAWQRFFVETKFLSAASENPADGVLLALNHYAEPFRQLEEAGRRPGCSFPVHWEKGPGAPLPHLQVLMSASKLYALRLAAHLGRGESAAAYEDWQSGMRLYTATAREPVLLSGLVRMVAYTNLRHALWSGLARHQWAEPELRKIEADLSGVNILEDYSFSTNSERAAMNLTFDIVTADPKVLVESIETGKKAPWYYAFYPSGWIGHSKLRSNRFVDESLARVDPAQHRYHPERPCPSGPKPQASTIEKFPYMLFYLITPVWGPLEKRFLQTAAETDLAGLACALERHRIAKGEYPETLDALVPGLVPSLPREIVNGQPYHYRRSADGGFVLHSGGTDSKDDGGVLDPKPQADWVWEQPGKKE